MQATTGTWDSSRTSPLSPPPDLRSASSRSSHWCLGGPCGCDRPNRNLAVLASFVTPTRALQVGEEADLPRG